MLATTRAISRRSLQTVMAFALAWGGGVAPSFAAETFDALVQRTQKEKPTFAARQKGLLAERYDLSDSPAAGVTMSKGKPVQGGVRVKLPAGTTWDQLAGMTPDEIKSGNLWPAGFYPLPHPHHEAGGMIFPQPQIDGIKQQDGRDISRFDLDFPLATSG